jgi:hypothetical protein
MKGKHAYRYCTGLLHAIHQGILSEGRVGAHLFPEPVKEHSTCVHMKIQTKINIKLYPCGGKIRPVISKN